MKPQGSKTITLEIVHLKLPEKCDGAVGYDPKEPDTYTVFINSEKDEKTQRFAFLHEMVHIYEEDFDSMEDVQVIERRAHDTIREIINKQKR